MEQAKECHTCHIIKPLSQYHSGTGKYKRMTICIECQRAYKKEWAEKNKARLKQKKVQYYLDNQEHIKQQTRERRLKDLDRFRQSERDYAASHREEAKARSKKWAEEHKEQKRITNKLYHVNNRTKINAMMKAYRQKHPDKARLKGRMDAARRRAKKLAAGGSHTKTELMDKYKEQQGLCFYCHKDVGSRFDADHVIPLSKGGTDFIQNIVIACPSCNRSKSDKTIEEWERSKIIVNHVGESVTNRE